jgi:uncharacterized membrane protein YfcA
MTPGEIAWIVAGSGIGGFVSGLTGFGTTLTAMPFFLMVLQPANAAMLGASLGMANQIQTLPGIWSSINWSRVLPMIGGGLLGLPIGAMILPRISLGAFKLFVGLVLIGYCSFMLAGMLRGGAGLRLRWGGRPADIAVGVGGGLLTGIAALSGPLPIIWASLQDWSKNERRGVFQAYNSAMLTAMLATSAATGLMSWTYGTALLWALPGTVLGAYLGTRVYRRLDDRRFDRLVMLLLLIAGIFLVASSQAGGRP